MTNFEILGTRKGNDLEVVATPGNFNSASCYRAEDWAKMYLRAGYSEVKIIGNEKDFEIKYAKY